METAIELTDQEKEIMRARQQDESWHSIGRRLNLAPSTAHSMLRRVNERLERQRQIEAGYIDPSPKPYGGFKSEIIKFIDENPGSSTSEIARGLRRTTNNINSAVTRMEKLHQINRIKQDGFYRIYPRNYKTPTIKVGSLVEKPHPKGDRGITKEIRAYIVTHPGLTRAQLVQQLPHISRNTMASSLSRLLHKGNRIKMRWEGDKMHYYDRTYKFDTNEAQQVPDAIVHKMEDVKTATPPQMDQVEWVEAQFVAYFLATETPSLRGFISYIKNGEEK